MRTYRGQSGTCRAVHVDRLRIGASTPVSHAHGQVIGPQPTPDGRFLLWSGNNQDAPAYQVNLFDVANRQKAILIGNVFVSAPVPLAVHPSAMRAFAGLTPGGQVTVLEPGNIRSLPPPPCTSPAFVGRSGDGGRLLYTCGAPHSVIVADSGDGRTTGAVPLGTSPFTIPVIDHVLDASGSTLYTIDRDNAFDGDAVRYRRFDVATGALLTERRGWTSVAQTWAFDGTGQLYAGTWGSIHVIDASTLADIGWIGGPPGSIPMMAFDPDRPDAYIAWRPVAGGRTVRLSLVHTGTLATLGWLDLDLPGQLAGIALGPRPPQVSDLNATVQPSTATLSWTIAAGALATHQLLEVGLGPGRTDASLVVAAGVTSVTRDGVPPGRYYVRVRSVNGTGVGAPSNEVIVDVP